MEVRKKIMVDMDDVACDYKSRFIQRQEENPFISWPPAEYSFFRDLDPIEDAIESINTLRTKYDVYFLTRPSVKNPMCYTEKRDWVGKYFDYEMCEKLILCYHKHLVMGDYLIDDNIHPGFVGEHIHFGQGKFKTWKQVLEYLM